MALTRVFYSTDKLGRKRLILPFARDYPPIPPAVDTTRQHPLPQLELELVDIVFGHILPQHVAVDDRGRANGETNLQIFIYSSDPIDYEPHRVLAKVCKTWRAYIKTHFYEHCEWKFETPFQIKKLLNPLKCIPARNNNPIPSQQDVLLHESNKPTLFRIRKIGFCQWRQRTLPSIVKELLPLADLRRIRLDGRLLQNFVIANAPGCPSSDLLSDPNIDPEVVHKMSFADRWTIISEDSRALQQLCDSLFKAWQVLLDQHDDADIRERMIQLDPGPWLVKVHTRDAWMMAEDGIRKQVSLHKYLTISQYVREHLKKRATSYVGKMLHTQPDGLGKALQKLDQQLDQVNPQHDFNFRGGQYHKFQLRKDEISSQHPHLATENLGAGKHSYSPHHYPHQNKRIKRAPAPGGIAAYPTNSASIQAVAAPYFNMGFTNAHESAEEAAQHLSTVGFGAPFSTAQHHQQALSPVFAPAHEQYGLNTYGNDYRGSQAHRPSPYLLAPGQTLSAPRAPGSQMASAPAQQHDIGVHDNAHYSAYPDYATNPVPTPPAARYAMGEHAMGGNSGDGFGAADATGCVDQNGWWMPGPNGGDGQPGSG